MFCEPCKIALQIFDLEILVKSSTLIFNEAMATVSLKYRFQNSHVLSIFTNNNK